MLEVLLLMFCVFAFAGIYSRAGFLDVLLAHMLKLITSVPMLIITTLFSSILVCFATGSTYLSILMLGELFSPIYERMNVASQNLSRTLEDAGVVLELLEQPVKARDIDGLKYVTDRVHTPVMADESVFGPAEVVDLIKLRAADIINIKLMKTGGISNAIRIADIAALYGVDCMIGCMIETSISVAAAVHVAVAKSHVITKVDLDGPSLCQFNPVEGGVIFNESEITITDAPGLGITAVNGLEWLDA